MNETTDRPRIKGGDRSAADVKADEPKRSLDRLAALTRKVLKMPKERLGEILEK